MHENSDPSRFSEPGRDLFRKTFGVRRSPPKKANLKSAMLNMEANAAVSEQQNCSNSMLKLAGDLKVGPLDFIRSALHTEPNFVFSRYKGKFSNTQHHLVVKYE